jgi:outer membrane protein
MKQIISIIIIFLSLLNTQAQEQLSMSDAIRIGLENNYDLQIQRNSEKIAGINNTWGNTSVVPGISFNATGRESFNYNDVDDYRQQTITPDLSLNWVIFNGFSARINKLSFDDLETQSKGNTAILVENTIQDIILAYNNCLLQKEMVAVFKELADLSEDRYNRTLDSKDIGAGTTYESLQAKTSWLEDQSNLLQQKVTFENAVRTLNFALAVTYDAKWGFISGLTTNTPDYDIENLSDKMKSSNNTLKNQYLYQSLLAKETALAKSAYSPKLSLNTGISNTDFGKYYSGATSNINQNYTDAYVGITFSYNIFNGGTRKRSVAIAKIGEESADVKTSQIEHSLNNQLLQIYSNYQVQRAVLDLANQQEASAKLNLELSEERLKNGNINSFNYRDVQIIYMNAAIAKLRTIYNVIQSNTDLLRITGGIISEFDE